ncbi:hypothetical protein E4V99_01550 [Microbacterium sp. dk485]|uniref:hypothetical protein n=1 Tax=Microbacterium sp. dk485 TaxID=2560021 RepID=UPI0010732ED4|nr:hypothetical protein [Microbacterium sp. dk485]TFV83801.1 hypothetical protein E4V99_01550 [Microbacterium sp. dk485]
MVRRLRATAGALLRTLPEEVAHRLAPNRLGWRPEDVPAPIVIPEARVRLLVGPANSAAQGYAWAHSARLLPHVAAVNLAVPRDGGPRFAADHTVPSAVFARSRQWGRAHASAVESQVTHVLVESERPVLGTTCGADVRREAAWLDARGIARAYVSHGSDLRLPSRHAELDPLSPFRDPEWGLRSVLEDIARRNGEFLAEQHDRPVFVATADLLRDVPRAVWLPNVVDPAPWANRRPALDGGRPVVMHAPTNERIKGTALIRGAVRRLHEARVISYRPVRDAPHAAMPSLYAGADIVLEQFRLGIYSTTAIEAMAAGRLVVGRISDDVRRIAEREAGIPLPILDAHPDELEDLLVDVASDPGRYGELALRGPDFVRALHDGRYVARVLTPFLGATT